MSEIMDLVTIDDDYGKLRETGLFYQKKTVESLLSFSVVVNILKSKCDNEEDVDFAGLALEYWGLSASGASQTAKIGANVETLSEHMDKLPPSARTLYELTSLKPKELAQSIDDGLITPSTTVTEAKSLKLGMKEDKRPTESANPFAIEASKEGETVQAELMPSEDEVVIEEEKAKPKKMKAPEAIEYLNINVKQYYDDAVAAGLTPRAVLDEAISLLTGKK